MLGDRTASSREGLQYLLSVQRLVGQSSLVTFALSVRLETTQDLPQNLIRSLFSSVSLQNLSVWKVSQAHRFPMQTWPIFI